MSIWSMVEAEAMAERHIKRRASMSRREHKRKCIRCKKLFPESEIEFSPDPYAERNYPDAGPVWECESCRDKSADRL